MPAFRRLVSCMCRLAAALVVIAAAAPRQAAATQYIYSLIADELGAYSHLTVDSPRALNDAGQVAFYSRENIGFDGHVFRHNGGSLTTIAAEPGFRDITEYAPLALNDAGAVVFTGSAEQGHFGIFAGAGVGLSTVIDQNSSGAGPRRGFDNVAVNDAGQVAYRGSRINFPDQPENVGQAGYYVIDGQSITTIAEVGSGYTSAADHAPAFNDAGQLAFYMRPSASEFHLLRYTPGVGIATLATGFSGAQDPSINSDGDVAFIQSSSVKAHINGAVATIADTAGGYFAFFSSGYGRTMINDSGQVAFFAQIDDGGDRGIFTGPDPLADRVILDGQMLFGHEVSVEELVGFNNRGQVLVMVDVGTSSVDRALILATPLAAADFQEDGDVDGADLDLWEGGYGPSAMHTTGDADDDGDADGADFLVWQQQLGGGSQQAVTAAVPEPASSLLVLMAGILAAPILRRRQ